MKYLEIALYSLAGIGLWACLTSLVLYLRDRSGNSGRSTHWTSNPRIKSPGELSDEDHEAYGAMLYAMKPREDRKD